MAAVAVIILVILLAVFIMYPAPPLTQNLQTWMTRGQFVEFKNKQIFYIDITGRGSSGNLFCLHGFPSSSYDWIKILNGLEEKFNRIVVFDFLGYGFSDKPVKYNYTIGEQADISIYLLEHLQVKQVHLLSHDYGDTVALEILARYNRNDKIGKNIKLQSLSMLNGGIFQETHHPRILQKLLLYPVIGPVLSKLIFYQIFERGFGEIFGSVKPTYEEMWEFWVSLRYNDGTSALSRIINFLPERKHYNERWVGALKETKIPVQMIYGPADPVNPRAFIQYFRKVVPQHKLVVLEEDVGHYPQWEKADDVITAMQDFIHDLHK